MSNITAGSRWVGANYDKFRVTGVSEQEGKVLIYYSKLGSKLDNEFNCLKDAFLERFRELKPKRGYWPH